MLAICQLRPLKHYSRSCMAACLAAVLRTAIALSIMCFAGVATHADQADQSALAPASAQAEGIATLWWIMLYGACAIFIAVMAILAFGLWRAHTGRSHSLSAAASRNLVIVAGVIIPLITVIALVGGSLTLGNAISSTPPEDALKIRVTGWMWWWQIEYLDADNNPIATTANELHIPVGRPVHVLLESADVIHSFWVPQLQGKTDMIPGIVNHSWFTADRPGIFRGQCAEFCGAQHAFMAFLVIAQTPEEFEDWLEHQQAGAAVPINDQQRRGQQVFTEAGCHFCHSVRGTPADGKNAPDLTHIASRQTLAAVTLTNNRGHLTGWVADPQGIKPGSFMPGFSLDASDFNDLIAYLESLQ